MNVKAYKLAINKTVNLIKDSNIEINYFNVGGGFPSKYPGMNPDPLKNILM